MAWGTGDKLAAAGVVIAVLGIVIGAFTAIDPQEAGCLAHLRSCSSKSGSQASGNGGPSSAESGLAPSPTPPGILPGADPSLPYPLVTPPTYPATSKPTISVSPDSVVNRGTSVVIMVTGSGFTRNGTLSISLYEPEGSTFLGGSGYPVDVDGTSDRRSSGIQYVVTETPATTAPGGGRSRTRQQARRSRPPYRSAATPARLLKISGQ